MKSRANTGIKRCAWANDYSFFPEFIRVCFSAVHHAFAGAASGAFFTDATKFTFL
jgi:hypothetical protein